MGAYGLLFKPQRDEFHIQEYLAIPSDHRKMPQIFVPNLCLNQSENTPKTSSEASPKTVAKSKACKSFLLILQGLKKRLTHIPKLDVAGSNPVARFDIKPAGP